MGSWSSLTVDGATIAAHKNWAGDAGHWRFLFQQRHVIPQKDMMSTTLGECQIRLALAGIDVKSVLNNLRDRVKDSRDRWEDFVQRGLYESEAYEYLEKPPFVGLEEKLKSVKCLQEIEAEELIDFFERDVSYNDPLYLLCLLAENKDNKDMQVVWEYGDIIAGGWAMSSDFYVEVPEEIKFRIITEGTTDAYILEKALKRYHPGIVDFFVFLQRDRKSPLTGVAGISSLAKGLASMKVPSLAIVIYDNDFAGASASKKLAESGLPQNIVALTLPNLESFVEFPCDGPNGEHCYNINGRAASIECYLLDCLSRQDCEKYEVKWTQEAYGGEESQWQGSLEGKHRIIAEAKNFLKNQENCDGCQGKSIRMVLAEIISTAQALAANNKSWRHVLDYP